MKLHEILARLTEAVRTDPENAIQADYALREELVGNVFFDAPLLGCAAADDPLFMQYRNDETIYGSALRLPEEWLPGAKSVLSFFMPYTAPIRGSNVPACAQPSDAWLHARIEGQNFILKLSHLLAAWLHEVGYEAVVPADHPEYRVVRRPERAAHGEPPYVSNWSERHAAYAAGLGTFSLSKNLITEKGVCGRFGSVITNAPIDVTARAYTEVYEYCSFCGLCGRYCPGEAISIEKGKDLLACSAFLETTKVSYAPRYGCGKCQMSVPCETKIPGK